MTQTVRDSTKDPIDITFIDLDGNSVTKQVKKGTKVGDLVTNDYMAILGDDVVDGGTVLRDGDVLECSAKSAKAR